jgi:glycerate-2-kinase
VDPGLIRAVVGSLIDAGTPIEDLNLVRSHLSAIKGGGLAVITPGPVETLVLSDLPGLAPGLVASGPTATVPHDPERVISLIESQGIKIDTAALSAIREPRTGAPTSPVTVVADGRTAAAAMVAAARAEGVEATQEPAWLQGAVDECVRLFLDKAPSGILVATGESTVSVTEPGSGGRNTHAALLGAKQIAGTDRLFAPLATDGCDGSSGSAGAIVDGTTIERGGSADLALGAFDSAVYLGSTGDLVVTGPTGTNVADLWVSWQP